MLYLGAILPTKNNISSSLSLSSLSDWQLIFTDGILRSCLLSQARSKLKKLGNFSRLYMTRCHRLVIEGL